MEPDSLRKGRMYQIDALRIFCMFFVCILHTGGGFGGLTGASHSIDKVAVLLMLCIADVAVNCFMMISGYVSWRKEWKMGRYIALWAQVAFYTVGLAVLAGCIHMAQGHDSGLTWRTISSLTLPVPFASAYWYFTVYTSVFLLAPVMGLLQARLNQKQMLAFILCGMLLISLCGPLSSGPLVWGYSTAWLCIMYMVGSYLREYPIQTKRSKAWFCIILITLLNTGCSVACMQLGKHGIHLPYFPMDYCFPFTAALSILFFIVFASMEITGKFACKAAAILSPLSFAVYLIHSHPCAEPFFRQMFGKLSNIFGCSFITVIVASILIYCGASILDAGRLQLFKRLKIRQWSDQVGERMEAILKSAITWLVKRQ